jgi:uncharacterized cupin superfamily protein
MNIEVRKPTEEEKNEMTQQPTWSSEVKTFPWHYDDKETCLIIEGEVTVKTPSQEVSFGSGDYVVFPQGLDCTWEVKAPVRKYFKFG